MRAGCVMARRHERVKGREGLIRPYRPCPPDFREVYLANGWDGPLGPIDEHYGTNWRCITRWIEECGGDELRAERARLTGAPLRPKRRRAFRYVAGRTLRRIEPRQWPYKALAPRLWDTGLVEASDAPAPKRIGPVRLTPAQAARLAMLAVAEEASDEFKAGVEAAVARIMTAVTKGTDDA